MQVGIHYQGIFYEFVPWNGVVNWEVSQWGYWCMSAENKSHKVILDPWKLIFCFSFASIYVFISQKPNPWRLISFPLFGTSCGNMFQGCANCTSLPWEVSEVPYFTSLVVILIALIFPMSQILLYNLISPNIPLFCGTLKVRLIGVHGK